MIVMLSDGWWRDVAEASIAEELVARQLLPL